MAEHAGSSGYSTGALTLAVEGQRPGSEVQGSGVKPIEPNIRPTTFPKKVEVTIGLDLGNSCPGIPTVATLVTTGLGLGKPSLTLNPKPQTLNPIAVAPLHVEGLRSSGSSGFQGSGLGFIRLKEFREFRV